jgi:VWFA-related protein
MKASSVVRRSSCIFLCCFSLSAMAQQNIPSPPNAPPTESPLATTPANPHDPITLDVVVSDRGGNPIPGLQQQDFTLLDNKQPQKLLSFHAIDRTEPPPQVILLVDAVNTSFTSVSYEREQIVRFLSQNGGKLAQPVSIIFFTDDKTTEPSAPTRDGNALIAFFDKSVTGLRTLTRATGFYGAEDRLQLSIRTIGMLARYETGKPGRKLVVWISPGWPILSGPRVTLSDHDEQSIFKTVVALSTDLRLARITLDSVDPLGTADAAGFRTFYYQNFLKGLRKASQAEVGDLALQVLATQSGGQVLHSSNDITAEIARCTTDASTYYELSFNPPPADGPNDYHALEVKTDKSGVTARTRTGYYAQP